jgi:tetratricopeptide (TPR) repeat protein
VLGLVGIGFWQMRRRPMLSFAILFFFLNHVVESSIIGLELIYEHRNYLPSLFLFVPLAACLQALVAHERLKSPRLQRLVVLFIILLPAGFGIGTYVRNMAWLDAKIFWEDASRKAPLSMRPLHNLAYYHYERTGQYQKAFDLYHEALSKQDNNRLIMSLPHIKIAEHYERSEDFEKAGEHLEKALAIFPEFEQVQLRLALVRFSADQLEKALAAIAPLVEKRPRSFDCRYLMAQILLKMGQTENALSNLQTCMLLAPNSEKAVFMMGIASNLYRNCEMAQRFLNRVLERFPKDKHALLWMIDCHLQTGDFAAAKDSAGKLLEGVSIDRIEHMIAQTLSEGFMAEAGQKRLSLWIKNQAHAASDPELETGKHTEAASARKQRYGV